MNSYLRRALPAVLVLALLGAPAYLGRSALNDLWNIALAVVLASAWNIMGGLAGQVSFGYAVYLGIGAYATVLMTLHGWNAYATIPFGMVLAAAVSVVIGLPAFRLRGPYFTIATIGIGEVVRLIAQGLQVTGGAGGLRLPARYGDFLYHFLPGLSRMQTKFLENYYSMMLLALLVLGIVWWLQHSRLGFGLTAIRQDIDAAEALGVSATRYKLAAHALSAALTAVAGSLYAVSFQYVAPNSVFAFTMSLQMVLMPVIGGVGTLLGPVIGGTVFGYLQIKLLTIPALRSSNLMIYGLLLIVVILFEPGGILGLYHRAAGWVQRLIPKRTAAFEKEAPDVI